MVRYARLICLALGVTTMLSVATLSPTVSAQSTGERQPIDMMVVIDNSCSMFPREQILSNCTEYGNDPGFLRISGADLFIARLGFAESNSTSYQMGIISMGEDPPDVVSPLQPLNEARDTLARLISNPAPQAATQIVPALKLAYQELAESPARRPGNTPAIVLLTDGKPYPAAGQSNDAIRALVSAHPNVPLFVMLLQSPTSTDTVFEQYIALWEQMQRDYSYVRTYRIRNTRDVEQTYNQIVARLQNTVPTSGFPLAPGATLRVYVSRYVQRLVVTILHEVGKPKGKVDIRDSIDVLVKNTDADVEHFVGTDNPVEVVSIGVQRLNAAPRNDIWTVTSASSAPVVVFLDRAGAYSFDFVQPKVGLTTVPNQFLVQDRFSPTQPFVVKFKLVDKADNAVMDPQPITGRVVHPDGSTAELRIPSDLRPDADGVYEISHDFATTYPAILNSSGRFALLLEAGAADESAGRRIPIANADLLVEVGRGAYIQAIAPDPISCAPGQSASITVTGGDLQVARGGTVIVRASRVSDSGSEITLTPGADNTFVGSLDGLCQGLFSGLACSATTADTLRVWMVSENTDGTVPPRSEKTVPITAQAVACTPTPTPVPTATPTPTPTPIPDSDTDGLNDLADQCPRQAQWPALARFSGCPPPLWLIILMALVGLGLLAFIVVYVIPWLLVNTIKPPPDGYVLICGKEKHGGSPKSIRTAGLSARRSTVTIGAKGHIRVPGASEELRVVRRGKDTLVVDAKTGVQRMRVQQFPGELTVGDYKLKFSTEQSQLRC